MENTLSMSFLTHLHILTILLHQPNAFHSNPIINFFAVFFSLYHRCIPLTEISFDDAWTLLVIKSLVVTKWIPKKNSKSKKIFFFILNIKYNIFHLSAFGRFKVNPRRSSDGHLETIYLSFQIVYEWRRIDVASTSTFRLKVLHYIMLGMKGKLLSAT